MDLSSSKKNLIRYDLNLNTLNDPIKQIRRFEKNATNHHIRLSRKEFVGAHNRHSEVS